MCAGNIILIITVRNKNYLSKYKYFGSIVQGCYETIIFTDCQTLVDISVASKTWGDREMSEHTIEINCLHF